MRAVSYAEYGGPEVLEVVELTDPDVGAGRVRVAVRAAGLNPFDSKVRRGGYIPNHTLPSRQGAEFAGVVESTGEGVTDWAVGDEVLGWMNRGAQASLVVVPPTQLARKPHGLTFEAAAGIGLVGNTAIRGIGALDLDDSDTVIISGATGGVGLIASQLAVRTSATVVGLAHPRNHDLLRELGVIPVAYGDGQRERIADAADGCTAMFDTVGGSALADAIALGVQVSRINTIADFAFAKEHGTLTVGGGGKTAEELRWLAEQVATGELLSPVRAVFPVDQVVDAYRELEGGHGPGKVVLTFP